MELTVISLSHKTAEIAVREKVVLSAEKIPETLSQLQLQTGAKGIAILSTCNRMEWYFSSLSISPDSLLTILSQYYQLPTPLLTEKTQVFKQEQGVSHLFSVACGLQSQVPFDDQIITQVKETIQIAREAKTVDSHLETLFRLAISCGKKVKTQFPLPPVPPSVATSVITLLEKHYPPLGKKILVIGSGTMGRLCCERLVALGADVTMTLRTFRPKETLIPHGVDTIPYQERQKALGQADIIISATKSPHFTLTPEMFADLEKMPSVLIDLALPRDIHPDIATNYGVPCYTIDTLSQNTNWIPKHLPAIEDTIKAYMAEYDTWLSKKNQKKTKKHFPLFVCLEGKKILVVGGGTIATRRVHSLLDFGANITVVAPCLSNGLLKLEKQGDITIHQRPFAKEDMDGAFLILTATNRRQTNEWIGLLAKEKNIPVSVADASEESNFYFPALFETEEIIGGLVSKTGKAHREVKDTGKRIRNCIGENLL